MTISKKSIMNYLNNTVESIQDSFKRELYNICQDEAQELVGITWFLWHEGLINEVIRENYLEIAHHFKWKAFMLK